VEACDRSDSSGSARAYALIESLPLANGPATCRVEIPDENAVAKLLEEVRPKLPRASIKWSDFTLVIGKQPPDRKSGAVV